MISAYQTSLMKQCDQVMNTLEAQNASPRKLTTLERGQIELKFIQMNEKPKQFLLDNRYLEKHVRNQISTGKRSNLKKLQAELDELLKKLDGVYTDKQIQKMKQDADDSQQCNLHGRQKCDVCQAIKQLYALEPVPHLNTESSVK